MALDVLPLDAIDLDGEIKDLVGLMKKQAMEIQFGVESDDQKILRLVFSVLNQFECGVVPEATGLRNVLEYLCIRTWNDCNNEVKFLDSEISLELQTTEKKNFQLLSSLVCLMVYCRCTLFEVVDRVVGRQNDDDCLKASLRCLNADDFRCPITLEIMNDPITIETGHTYDRPSILKWFKAGYPTCPKTGKRLLSTDVVPNFALKKLIRQYLAEVGIPFSESVGRPHDTARTAVSGSVASEKAIKLLAHFLVCRLMNGNREEQIKAAYEIRMLTKTNVFSRFCLVEANAIPPLLNLLASNDPSSEENATASLLNLSKFSECRSVIVENGGLKLIVNVLKKGQRMEARQHAAGTLFYLASVEKYRVMIGEIPGCILALVELLRNGDLHAKKNSLVTIYGLLVYPGNHTRVLAAGLVPLLVDLLNSREIDNLSPDAVAVLSTLADKPGGAKAIRSSGAFPIIEEMLGTSNSRSAREYCVSLLLSMCIHGDTDVVSVLANNTTLIGSLYSELAVGTSRASKKASSLIRILHNFTERSFGFSTSALPQERFVDVS